jgi:hypothetical protein
MKYAKITFLGVNSPSGGQPVGSYIRYIHGPMPSVLRPFSVSFLSSSGYPYSPGYYTKNTFPSGLTTDQYSLSFYQLRYLSTYQIGWEVFSGTSAFAGATTFTNEVDGASGSATVDLYDDFLMPTSDQKSPLIGPDFVWGWDGFIWRWIDPTETLHADILAAGGGRYHQSIVTVAHGQIYYGSIT